MRPRIRAATLTGYAELTASLGLDPDRLATSVGLHLADLDAPDRWVPAGAAARLLELSARASGCADFGLRMAGLRRLGTLGPLSVALRDEPTLRSALDLLIRYEHGYNEALHLRMRDQGDLTTVATWLEFGEPVPTDQASDLVIGALLGIIRALLGPDWMPRSASFTHAAPEDPGPYHQLCGPRVRFADEFTGVVLWTRQLDAAVLTADSSLRPYSHGLLRTIASPGAVTTTARATEAVEFLLPLGRCSVRQVGRQLGLSARELQRRLAEEDGSFSSVVEATRARQAERLLQNSRRTLTEISLLLGFAAPSAFSRWFAQHFGTSPSAWRMAARTGTASPSAAPRAGRPSGSP
jgi:AraC-like DNA-binding protein